MRYLLPLLAVVFVACGADTDTPETKTTPVVEIPADAVTYNFAVEGMDCEGCVAHVKKTLEGVDGVARVKVDLKSKSATCIVGKDVQPAAIVKMVTGKYKATLKP